MSKYDNLDKVAALLEVYKKRRTIAAALERYKKEIPRGTVTVSLKYHNLPDMEVELSEDMMALFITFCTDELSKLEDYFETTYSAFQEEYFPKVATKPNLEEDTND